MQAFLFRLHILLNMRRALARFVAFAAFAAPRGAFLSQLHYCGRPFSNFASKFALQVLL
jgi:hypothetical protein